VASDGVNANGVALRLASIATGRDAADRIGEVGFAQYFSGMMTAVGAATTRASADADVQQSVLNQARNLRTQASGVSLDEEALHLIELQRAYEAVAQLTGILNEMTETILGIVR
jgi:flagellar hook-associated protein 1 FlgK